MKKRILSLVLALLFTVGIFGAANSAFAMEDGDYRIVFGADLTDEQRSQVIGMFGIQGEVDENRILTVLMENKGKIVSRETLMARLWETDAFVDENTLSVNITRLRRKLAAVGAEDLIKTRKGMGYLIE